MPNKIPAENLVPMSVDATLSLEILLQTESSVSLRCEKRSFRSLRKMVTRELNLTQLLQGGEKTFT